MSGVVAVVMRVVTVIVVFVVTIIIITSVIIIVSRLVRLKGLSTVTNHRLKV